MDRLLFKLDKWFSPRRALAAFGLALAGAAQPAAPSQQISAQVEEAARRALQQQAERAAWLDPRFEVTVVTDRRAVAACADPVDIQATDTRHPSRMRFTVSCPGHWQRVFVVRADISARVVVAADDVPARQPLQAADLALARRDLSATPEATSDLQAAAGQASRRAMRRGDIVQRNRLVAPVLVRRGETVRIVARREQLEVSMNGEALDAGGRDDLVRVRNSSTGKVIRARVTDAAVVEPADR